MFAPSPLDGLRFDGHGPHVESTFLKANDGSGTRAIWLKATLLCTTSGARWAEAWAIAFKRGQQPIGARTRVPLEDAWFARDDLGARVAGCDLDRRRAFGALGAGPQRLAWELTITNTAAPLYPLSPRLYALPVSSSKPTSPLPDARVSGVVSAFGEEWKLDGWRGLVGHNWGKAHTHAYAWAQCNAWDERDDVVLEIGLGKPRVGPFALGPFRLLNARVGDEAFDLSSLARSLRNRGDFDLRSAWFEGEDSRVALSGELSFLPLETAALRYDNPDGSVCHCLNSKLASATVRIEPRGRAPIVLTTRRAALEIGTRDPNHGITCIA